MKHRDFPGNIRSGGCDSLLLVVAFTSKQHDSPLSYALHFLHIISHQMCCAGERAERRTHQSVEKSLHLPEKKLQEKQVLSQRSISGCQGQQQVCRLLHLKERKNKESRRANFCIYHWSMSAGAFDMLFILGEGRAPRLPAVTKVRPWTWPDAGL